MDPNDIIRKVHRRVLNSIQNKSGKTANATEGMKAIIEKDQALRKSVADLYATLVEANDPALAVELLAEHIAIMVEMINEFKNKITR
ncbi:MAG: hypothetical protein N2316_02420 [Spirochaetes bacterium]|nr:hypothetical protein [Spirochaetota bacterium]